MPTRPFIDRFDSVLAFGSGTYGTALAPVDFKSQGRINYSPDISSMAITRSYTAEMDKFRQGVSVSMPLYFFDRITPVFLPRGMRGVEGVERNSLGQFTQPDLPDHSAFSRISFQVEKRNFGQPSLGELNESDPGTPGFVPFTDMAAFNAKAFILDKEKSQFYPQVLDNTMFLSPSFLDGIIEPLGIRSTIIDTSPESPFAAHRVRGDMQTGDLDDDEKGACQVRSVIEVRQGSPQDYFFDSQEEIFQRSVPGFMSDDVTLISPFNDTIIYEKDKYTSDYQYDTFYSMRINLTGSLTGSGMSEIGTRYLSAVCGFTYRKTSVEFSGSIGATGGIHTTLGTDSIAFGGMFR